MQGWFIMRKSTNEYHHLIKKSIRISIGTRNASYKIQYQFTVFKKKS